MSSVPSAGERYIINPARWRTLAAIVVAVVSFGAVAMLTFSGLGLVDLARWAATQQKAFHQLLSGLLSLKDGGILAFLSLIGACLVYGFVHAAVPGHGKFLVAGAGLGTELSAFKLVSLSLAGSLAQAFTAIVLVYGSFAMLDITAGWAMDATNRVLIPLSTLAIAAIGGVLAWRGWRGLARAGRSHGHGHGACCNHRHGATPDEAQKVHTLRDAIALVVSIGLRPCTGAVFALVAAWRLDLLWVGAAAAVAMAIGTGGLTSLVAVSATTARGATLIAGGLKRAPVLFPLLQFFAGAAIILASLGLLAAGFVIA